MMRSLCSLTQHARAYLGSKLCGFLGSHEKLRRLLIEKLKAESFGELGISIPVGGGVSVPIPFEDGVYSFGEIFCLREYEFIKPYLPPHPMPWLDVGSNCGHFSLWLIQHWKKQVEAEEFDALLVDADRRSGQAVEMIKRLNPWIRGIKFLHGSVSNGLPNNAWFEKRPLLGSQIHLQNSPHAGWELVKSLEEKDMLDGRSLPFAIVKIDVEGWEVGFVKNFRAIVSTANLLVVEWHSWNVAGMELEDFLDLVKQSGFRTVCGREMRLSTNRRCLNILGTRLADAY